MSYASSAVTYTFVYTDSELGRPIAPPLPDYIPGLEEPQTLPVPHDEDECEPMFIQPHDPDYSQIQNKIQRSMRMMRQDGPVDYPMDEGDDGDDDDGDSSGDDVDDEDEDEEEEEHLAPADSAAFIPTVELVS
nr:hypothetical protein [Tanacetum cinerariifolium]